jgi:hypothetical protein
MANEKAIEDRIEFRPVQRRGGQPQEGVGREEQEAEEGGADRALDPHHPRLQRLAQRSAEQGDSAAVDRQDQDPQQHRALVAAPGRTDAVDQGLRPVAVLSHQRNRIVPVEIARGQTDEGQGHEGELEAGRRPSDRHQGRIDAPGADEQRPRLHEGEHQGQAESELTDLGCHEKMEPDGKPRRLIAVARAP